MAAGARPGLIDRAGRTTLAELAAVVAGAEAVVCANTAAAVADAVDLLVRRPQPEPIV